MPIRSFDIAAKLRRDADCQGEWQMKVLIASAIIATFLPTAGWAQDEAAAAAGITVTVADQTAQCQCDDTRGGKPDAYVVRARARQGHAGGRGAFQSSGSIS
jgi:hypothetical protein